MNIDAIRDLVRSECLRASNRFGPDFFDQHLETVVTYGQALAQRLGADPRVVTLAGYLHDLAAVRDLSCVPTHHVESAALARALLASRGWPREIVAAVSRCIESHSVPVALGQGTPEEVCVSSADVLSQIARPAYWFYYLYGIRELGLSAGLSWLRDRVEGRWSELPPEARRLAAAERAVAVQLLAAGGGIDERS